jgi:CRISPR-associated endonuclease/helicase Cas3
MPQCIVLSPENGLAPLLAPAFENGLGAWRDVTGVLQGVYRDLSILELSRRLINDEPEWTIPAMNRRLVENATHPERIEALHEELGKAWVDYWCDVIGKDIADAGSAKKVALQVNEPFSQSLFASDEEKIRTRLGGEGAKVEFTEPVIGPFGATISGMTFPAHWSHGIDAQEPVEARAEANTVRFALGGTAYVYGRAGLIREET